MGARSGSEDAFGRMQPHCCPGAILLLSYPRPSSAPIAGPYDEIPPEFEGHPTEFSYPGKAAQWILGGGISRVAARADVTP